MLFFKTKKQTSTKVDTGLNIRKTVNPDSKPDFNTWCREFNVSSLHSYHTPMPHNGVTFKQN